MTQPFDANEFRRQQMVAGQVPQGQVPPAPQQMQPRPVPAPQPVPQPQMPHFQPQQAPQHQQHMPPQPQAYQQAMPPQPLQQQPQQAYAPPPSVQTAPAEAKKSLFKRGPKTPKAPKAENGSQGRSPALVFTTGLLTGVLITILGLKMMGQKAERPIVSAAAATQPGPAVADPNAPLIMHEPQIAPAGEASAMPMPKPVTP